MSPRHTQPDTHSNTAIFIIREETPCRDTQMTPKDETSQQKQTPRSNHSDTHRENQRGKTNKPRGQTDPRQAAETHAHIHSDMAGATSLSRGRTLTSHR